MKKLYRFERDCGRQGIVEGLFIEESAVVDAAIGKSVYFGEILGKHSDVSGTLDAKDLVVKSEDQDFLEGLAGLLGTSLSGYNPLDYLFCDKCNCGMCDCSCPKGGQK